MNERELVPGKTGVIVVANLPYNIATMLLIKWLTTAPWPPWFESLTLMFQREVAERIVAAPRSKSYGRLVDRQPVAHGAENPLRHQPERLHAGAKGRLDGRPLRAAEAAARRSRRQ